MKPITAAEMATILLISALLALVYLTWPREARRVVEPRVWLAEPGETFKL